MDLHRILNNDTSNLNEEEIKIFNDFNENLKEKLIERLIAFEIEDLRKISTEDFNERIYNMLFNGVKGYKALNTKQLIDIFLNKLGQENFIEILTNI